MRASMRHRPRLDLDSMVNDLNYFSAAQASRLTGCSPHQLRYWDQLGLVCPLALEGRRNSYSFGDLISLRLVRSLLEGGMTLRQVRRASEYVRSREDLAGGLAGVKLVTDGKTIFEVCHGDGEVLDVLKKGQTVLFIPVDELSAAIGGSVREFLAERDSFVGTLTASRPADEPGPTEPAREAR